MKAAMSGVIVFVLIVGLGGTGWSEPVDDRLGRAEAFVRGSDRYLHHSVLKRGMKGHGLSVFAGTDIERFDAEIVSVVTHFNPGRDVILARLSGQGLETSMVISGMSGSPVYMKDPGDGKMKMIGAVAYGWGLSKEPICGIQPITYMLAMPGVLDAAGAGKAEPMPDAAAGRAGRRVNPHVGLSSRRGGLDAESFCRVVFDPAGMDLDALSPARAYPGAAGQLRPMRAPLMVSSCRPEHIEAIGRVFAGSALQPLAGGGAGGADLEDLQSVTLQPGSAVAIPLASGDADFTALGTVTDVIGKTVLGFGHGFNGLGRVEMPMGTGYIHTVVPTLETSFKLGSFIRNVGTLNRDEYIGIGGQVGRTPAMIPMTVTVRQEQDDRKRVFTYRLVRDEYFTPRLAMIMTAMSASSLREPPRYWHAEYTVSVDFGELGTFKASGVRNGSDLWMGVMDIGFVPAEPIAAMLNNPFADPPAIRGIRVEMTLRPGDIGARIIDFRLDGSVYRPGQTVTGTVTLERFRKERVRLPVTLELPEDLPDGQYPLTVGPGDLRAEALQTEQPYRFQPRTVQQLFGALALRESPREDRLYLHLPRPGGGVAIGADSPLPDLPPAKAAALLEASLPETTIFRRSVMTSRTTPYVLSGRARAVVTVRKDPNETPVR